MSTSMTLTAGHGSEMGCRRCLVMSLYRALGIGMTNEVFQIDGRRQDLRGSL